MGDAWWTGGHMTSRYEKLSRAWHGQGHRRGNSTGHVHVSVTKHVSGYLIRLWRFLFRSSGLLGFHVGNSDYMIRVSVVVCIPNARHRVLGDLHGCGVVDCDFYGQACWHSCGESCDMIWVVGWERQLVGNPSFL